MPIPRKLKPLSRRILDAKLAAAIIRIGPVIFGKIWDMIILKLLKPKIFDADI